MRLLSMAAAAALFAAPSYAVTYYYDYTVGASSGTGGYYYDRDTGQSTTGDMTVTGYVETDGTIGEIDQTNILSWEFTISGEEDTITISSTPTFGDYVYSYGNFDATAETLSLRATSGYDYYNFNEYSYVSDEFGNTEEYIVGQLYGVDYYDSYDGYYNYDLAEIYGYERDCSSSGCTNTDYFGEYGYFYYNRNGNTGNTAFVGTSMSVVPLPAGFPLMLAGLGAFAYMRRRKAA